MAIDMTQYNAKFESIVTKMQALGSDIESTPKTLNAIDKGLDTVSGGIPTPTITSYPKASFLTGVGQEISNSTLLGGVARYGGNRIAGTFNWVSPTDIANETGYHNVVFVPQDEEAYQSVTISIQLVVVLVPDATVLKVVRQVGISDPAWTKIGFNATLTANANKLSSTPSTFVPAVDDYFDNPAVPVYRGIKICNVNDENGQIVSWLGDPDFRWNGSENTSVYTYYPTFWFKRSRNADIEEIEISESTLVGGFKVDAFIVATFWQNYQTITLPDDSTKTVLRSYAGITPEVLRVDDGVQTARAQARATMGANASGGDWRAVLIGWLHIVKYANNNVQAIIAIGRDNANTGNTAVGNAHLTLLGRDGRIGSETTTSVWSLGICDFYAHRGWLLDGVRASYTNQNVRFCSEPSKFVQTPAVDQEGYTELGYAISYSRGYTMEVGLDETNSNPIAQIIPLRVSGDADATNSTGTTDYYDYPYSYTYPIYAGGQGALSTNKTHRGLFGFVFDRVNGRGGSARVTKTL